MAKLMREMRRDQRLIGFLASMPPWTKGRLLCRVASKLASRSPSAFVHTNLGISKRVSFLVPASKSELVFGRPQYNLAERATLDLCLALAVDADMFVDVGANYGVFCGSVAATNDIPCIAVEADPELASLLEANVGRCGLKIEVVKAAASSENGQADFQKNLDDDLSGSLTAHFSDKHSIETISVPTLRLGDLLEQKNGRNCLLKVDVEGAGTAVWAGLKHQVNRVKHLLLEVIGPEAAARLPETICAESGLYSYYIQDYQLKRVEFANYEYVSPFWNWLFTRDDPAILRAKLPHRFEIIVDQSLSDT